jgi:hypothetical protein
MRAGVAALLDLAAVDANSTPTSDQVDRWLMEAAILMCEMADPDNLIWCIASNTTANIGQTLSLGSSSMQKLMSVVKNGVECTKISRDEMQRIKRTASRLYTNNNIAYCVAGDLGSPTIDFYPTTAFSVTTRVAAYPLAVASWADTTAYVPPTSWSGLLVDYVVMRAKAQDEELEQSELSMRRWQEKVQIKLGSGTIGSKTS